MTYTKTYPMALKSVFFILTLALLSCTENKTALNPKNDNEESKPSIVQYEYKPENKNEELKEYCGHYGRRGTSQISCSQKIPHIQNESDSLEIKIKIQCNPIDTLSLFKNYLGETKVYFNETITLQVVDKTDTLYEFQTDKKTIIDKQGFKDFEELYFLSPKIVAYIPKYQTIVWAFYFHYFAACNYTNEIYFYTSIKENKTIQGAWLGLNEAEVAISPTGRYITDSDMRIDLQNFKCWQSKTGELDNIQFVNDSTIYYESVDRNLVKIETIEGKEIVSFPVDSVIDGVGLYTFYSVRKAEYKPLASNFYLDKKHNQIHQLNIEKQEHKSYSISKLKQYADTLSTKNVALFNGDFSVNDFLLYFDEKQEIIGYCERKSISNGAK